MRAALAILLAAAAAATAQADLPPAGLQRDVRHEIECLAKTVYFEARGEPELGQRAVAHVVMNRVAHPGFADSVCGVVKQGGGRGPSCQFSWYCDGLSDQPREAERWAEARALARAVYWGESVDVTGGALYFHATHVSPRWREAFRRGERIGRHVFYTGAASSMMN